MRIDRLTLTWRLIEAPVVRGPRRVTQGVEILTDFNLEDGLGGAVYRTRDKDIRARLDFNPHSVMDGPAQLSRVQEYVSGLWDVVLPEGRLGSTHDLADAQVTRLDIARDIKVFSDPAQLIRGLEPLRRKHNRRIVTERNAKNGALTLAVPAGAGRKRSSGMVRLYDRGTMTGSSERVLRFEVEARSRWLEDAGVRRYSDLSNSIVLAMLEDRWRWSRMGTPQRPLSHLITAVDPRGLSGEEQTTFLGHAVMHAVRGRCRLSPNSCSKYSRLAEELGTLRAPALTARGPSTRLELYSGGEVLA